MTIPAEEGGMGGKKGGNLDIPALHHNETDTSLPLVEVSHNGPRLRGHIYKNTTLSFMLAGPAEWKVGERGVVGRTADGLEEEGDAITKDNVVVAFPILVLGHVSLKLVTPATKVLEGAVQLNEEDARVASDKPAAKVHLRHNLQSEHILDTLIKRQEQAQKTERRRRERKPSSRRAVNEP